MNQKEIFSFSCYKCQKENKFNRFNYIDGNEEIFLEAAGNPPSKEIIIDCNFCLTPNLIKIPLR